jgi:hypothetical protein
LLHLKNDSEQNFILINVLEYVTVILNYCGALTAYLKHGPIEDPHPVVLCVTDNISTKNWATHTCKKFIIGQALAHFFCGLMVGSQGGVSAKRISMTANKITYKILQLKKSHTSTASLFCYDLSKLKQGHTDLKHCRFYHPSQELLSLI